MYGRLPQPRRTFRLSVTSPPQAFTEPISAAEAASFLNLDTPIADDDAPELAGMISAAREWAEGIHKRELVTKQWDMVMDYLPPWQIELKCPLISVDLFQYKDSTGAVTALAENTDFIVDTAKEPGLILPPFGTQSWPSFMPWPSSAVLVRFTAGLTNDDPFWLSHGTHIKIGMKQLISLWHTRRLPFQRPQGSGDVPYEITACFSYGGRVVVR